MTALDPNVLLSDEAYAKASCKDHPSLPEDAWYALEDCHDGDPRHIMSREAAKALAAQALRVCQRECPIRQACLGGALERGERHGIFGGYTVRQRRAIERGIKRRQHVPLKLADAGEDEEEPGNGE